MSDARQSDERVASADVAQEIERLRAEIRRHEYAYFVEGQPLISDQEFDALFERLKSLEAQYPELVSSDSPTHRVGSDLSAEFPEVEHTVPVLSLDKAYSFQELVAFITRTSREADKPPLYVAEEKLDGVSIVLYYREGRLERAVTRGNGYVGNDVTANVRTIRTVPLRLERPHTVAVRGEIVLPKDRFNELNRRFGNAYANPRNLAAGTLRRVKSREVAQVPLEMFAYEGYFEQSPYPSHTRTLAELRTCGFRLNPRLGVFSDDGGVSEEVERMLPNAVTGGRAEMERFVEEVTRERDRLPHEIDGIVVKIDDLGLREALGYTGHHPRWAIAYKFESPAGITKVRSVDVQVGRTGRVTPVARVEPVAIAGTTVSNVTLHNQDYVEMLELSIGDTVSVSRRGDVIPAVERVVEKNEAGLSVWQMPEHCPSCHTKLERLGAHHFCTNYRCPDRMRQQLFFFVGRGQMDIEHLGPETLQFLIDRGMVREIPDIYEVDYRSLVQYEGFGERKVGLLAESVEESKSRPFRTVLASLGIPELGPRICELLIEAGFRSIDDLFRAADRDDVASLAAIPGIGEKMAADILAELRKDSLRQIVERLRRHELRFTEAEHDASASSATEGPFTGQTWCVTGSFEHFKPRSKAMEAVRAGGGRTVNDVSSAVTHLLAGANAGSKLRKAQRLGLKIVSEEEFVELLKRVSTD